MDPVPTRPHSFGPSARPPASGSELRVFRLAMAVLWTLVILALCWIPGSVVREIEGDSRWLVIPDFDKLVHGGIFIVFSILWARLGTSRRRFAWIALAGCVVAITTELVQRLPIIGRDGSIADTTVDIAGVLVGIVAAPLVEPLARAVESRIFRKPASGTVPEKGTTVSVEGVARPSH